MANEQYFNSNFYGNQIERMLEGLYNSSGILKSDGNGTISQALESDFQNLSSLVLITALSSGEYYTKVENAVNAGKIPLLKYGGMDDIFIYLYRWSITDSIGSGNHYYFVAAPRVQNYSTNPVAYCRNFILGNLSYTLINSNIQNRIQTGTSVPPSAGIRNEYLGEYVNLNTKDRYICLGLNPETETYVWQKIQNGVLDISISSSSDNTRAPSSKAVYDFVTSQIGAAIGDSY